MPCAVAETLVENTVAPEPNARDTISPLAGRPAPKDILVDLGRLERAYYESRPDTTDPTQLVRFGTSGHRGSPYSGTFTEAHIAAITQAICDYRRAAGIDGPLYMGKDTHALSAPAQRTALEVLAANGVETIIQQDDGVTPTPVDLAGDPHVQPRAHGTSGRRDRDHAVAQSAGGRRVQVQPAERRSGRHGRDRVDPGTGQRSAQRRRRRREAGAVRDSDHGADHAPAGLRPAVRRATCGTSSTWTRFATPVSRWASIRSAARPCRTGNRSTTCTRRTSTSSIP